MDQLTLTKPRAAHPRVPSKPRSTRKRGNWRKTLFRLHGWMGLNLGLLLFVICFSGSVATLSHEIDWLLNPAIRAETRAVPYNWSAMHETLADAFPDGQSLGVYAPLQPGFAAVAYVTVPNGQTRKVYLNPHTGALQGHTSSFNVQRFFRSFHRRFFDGDRGIVIVTLWGFVLLAASLTGFLFYKGWLKQLLTLRRGKGRRLLWSDLHKTTGIWGLTFALLIALTGIFYFAEVGFQGAGRYAALLPPPLPDVEEASLSAYGPQPELLPADVYVAAAREAFPGLEIRSMRMPLRPGDPVYLDGQAGNPVTRDRANKVHVHPFTAEVLGVQHSSDLGVVPFITDAVDPLHFGYVGGLWTKVLWCVLGLLLSFSILAGIYLWVVRSLPSRRTSRVSRRTAPRLRGAPVAFALTLAYFFVATLSTIDGIRDYGPQEASLTVARATVGPYRVRVDCAAPCRTEEAARFTVRFQGEGLPNYRTATLGPAAESGAELEGSARAPTATITATSGVPLRLRIATRDGAVHEATFPAPTSAVASPVPSLPDTAPGVWWVIGVFVALIVGAVAGWLYLVLRVVRLSGAEG